MSKMNHVLRKRIGKSVSEEYFFDSDPVKDVDIFVDNPVKDPYFDPPIKWDPIDPWDPGDGGGGGGGGSDTLYPKQVIYQGTVTDAYSNTPLASATITITKAGIVLARGIANAAGQFSIAVSQEGDTTTVSSAGYKTWSFPASTFQNKFELEPDLKELPTVVVTANKNTGKILLIALLLFLLAQKKKVA